MEERIPLTSRTLTHVHGIPHSERVILDEGSLELLEHLIAIVLQGNSQYLATLLQNEEILEVLDLHDNKGFTALHIASERVDPECVRLLLEADANPNVMDRFKRTALHWVVSGGCHCEFCDAKRAKCANLLLRAKGSLEIKDIKGETPLFYAAKNSFQKVATLMIEHGAETYQECNGVRTDELIVQTIPDVMIHLLDQSVTYDQDDNSKLRVDFKVLVQSSESSEEELKGSLNDEMDGFIRPKRRKGQKEMDLILTFLNSSPPIRSALLRHPVTQAFLYLKWQYVWKWIWFVRCFYSILTIAYTYFIFNLYLFECSHDLDQDATKSTENNVREPEIQPIEGDQLKEKCQPGMDLFILAICIASWAGLMILTSIYSVTHDLRSYCTSELNLGRWILIGILILTALPGFGILQQYWQWQYILAMFGVFYVWMMNLWHLGQIPYFGAYMRMLSKVLQRLLIVIVAYSSLFMAFTTGFYFLIPKTSQLTPFPSAVMNVFFLMVGNNEKNPDIFNPSQDSLSTTYWAATHVYYIGFILVFGIAIMNLLIALAVSDIQELQQNAEVDQASREIVAIYLVESLVSDNWISNCIQKCILSRISVTSRNGRCFRFSPIDPKDRTLPTKIKTKFIPLMNTRDCLIKRENINQPVRLSGQFLNNNFGLNRNDMFRGSAHSQNSTRGNASDHIDEILKELKQKLEGLHQQQRRRTLPRSNPVFC